MLLKIKASAKDIVLRLAYMDHPQIFKTFLLVHIFFGFLALFTFWIPLIAKKGQRLHISGGLSYVVAMSGVIITAIILCVIRLSDPHLPANRLQFSWFLLFICVLAATSAWYGLRVWQFGLRSKPHKNLIDLAASTLLLFSSIAMITYGFFQNNALIQYFPLIGVFLGSSQLLYWLRSQQEPNHAWFQHMKGMFSCVIATLTAFTVIGFPRIIHTSSENWLLWFGPSMILVPILIIWMRYYKSKFSKIKTL